MGAGAVIAGGLSLASTGLGAMGSLEAGAGQAAAADSQAWSDLYQAEQYRISAAAGRLKATQTNTEMTQNLTTTLGHMDAVAAAQHLDPRSPSYGEVRGTVETGGTQRKTIAVQSIELQAEMAADAALEKEAMAAYERSAASSAMLGGQLGAIGDIAKGLAGLPWGGSGGIIAGLGG